MKLEPEVKNFMKIMNCPNALPEISYFWRDNVEKFTLVEKYKYFEKLVNLAYIMFMSKYYHYANSDPTFSCFCSNLMSSNRDTTILQLLDDFSIILGLK